MNTISKIDFLKNIENIFEEVEKTGESIIITDQALPIFEIKKIDNKEINPLQMLKDSVIEYDYPTLPIEND